jgi:hypothetical protein
MSATGIEIPIISTYKDKGAKAASKSLGVLTKSAKALGLAFGAYQTLKFSKNAVKAFADDNRAAGQLSKTLQNLGQSYAVLSTAGFIQNLQNTTGVLDNQLRPAFTTLVNATLDAKKSQELLSIALDTSAGTGANLQAVTDALAKAALGENTALGKLGIGLSKTELTTMDLAKITDYLTKRFDGQAALAADSFAGKMDILKAKTEDAKEMIGGALVDALDSAFGNPEKYGSGIDSLASKISGLIKGFSDFIAITKVGLQNPTMSGSNPILGYKKNFDKPFNPMSMKFDYVKLQKEEKKLQLDAKKLAAARLAAIAKEKALIAEQKKIEADRKKLEQISSIFDLDQIQIYAALQNKITDQEKLRLSLQMALLQGNATEAGKLATELFKSQLQTTNLAEAIAKLPRALYPFSGWSDEIDLLLKQIELLKKLLSTMNLPTGTSAAGVIGAMGGYDAGGRYVGTPFGQAGSNVSTFIGSQGGYDMAANYVGTPFGQAQPSTTNIYVNGATQQLLNELRNGLIDSSASGSFATVNPNR